MVTTVIDVIHCRVKDNHCLMDRQKKSADAIIKDSDGSVNTPE